MKSSRCGKNDYEKTFTRDIFNQLKLKKKLINDKYNLIMHSS